MVRSVVPMINAINKWIEDAVARGSRWPGGLNARFQ